MTWFRRWFGAYVRRRVATGLDGVWVRNLAGAREVMAAGPVVFAATHVSWWDGMVLFPLDDALGNGLRVWMDAQNLEKHAWFRHVGALPLDASGAAGLRRSIREASGWLTGPGHALWVFPQGRHVPQWLRPLELRRGATLVATHTGAKLVPVAFAYGFAEAPAPRAVISFGAPVPAEELEAALVRELEHTDRFLKAGEGAFEALVPSRVSGTEDSWAARALAWLARRG